MKNKTKDFLLFVITFVASLVFSPRIGSLYEKIGRRVYGGWMGPKCPECWEGFLIGFSFFVGLLFMGFCNYGEKRLKKSIILILVPIVLLLIAWLGEAMLMALVFGVVGLGIGQIIYMIRTKCCKVEKKKK